MWNKSSSKIIAFASMLVLFASCKQSFFDVITHNDVGYWSRYWTPKDPHGVIVEYSKKDSIKRVINKDWTRPRWLGTYDDIHGQKFKITNDTMFTYISDGKGFMRMRDTLLIVSYSRNKIVVRNMKSELVTWHRIPTKFAKKQLALNNEQK